MALTIRYMKKTAFAILSIFITASAFSQEQIFDSLHIIAAGAQLKQVSSQFLFTEGPAVDKKGNIYFTDQPNDKIWKYDTHGKLELFMESSGRSNGLYFNQKGNIIACADLNNELWEITPDKKVTILLKGEVGKRHNGPNDLWLDKKEGIYFTDPYYQRPYWERKTQEIEGQKVYYLAKGSSQPVVVNDDVKKPNGIVGSQDGKYLFVADIGDNKTYRFDINPDGSLSNKNLHVEQGADGITLDNEGNLYLAGNGITVYNPAGIKIAHIPVPEKWCGNVGFGGKKRNVLFITASKSVFVLDMRVKGIE